MRRALILISLIFSLTSLVSASPTIIKGYAKGYEGRTIVFQSQADPLSRIPVDIEAVTVDEDGTFTLSANISEITRVSIDLSYYTAYIYLEPGVKYDVTLPPFRLRPDAERFNPFYEPRQIDLVINSSTSNLNHALRTLSRDFAKIYFPNAAKLTRRQDAKLADALIVRLDSAVRKINCPNPFFRQQAHFLKARIYATARLSSPRAVLSKYFTSHPVALNVPAYWQTIDMIEPDVIYQSPYPSIRKKLADARACKAPTADNISAILSQDTLFSHSLQLREALIVKNITDAYYARSISEGRADSLLTSAARSFRTHSVRLMAANVYAKKNKLRAGLPAPDFSLTDNRGSEVQLSSFHGRFLYLCFMHTQNYECLKAMPALDNLAQVHRDNLDILCVFTDERPDDAFRLVAKNGYTWKAISYISSQRILQDYRVAALPTYFLIDPDGCISIAQAPSPSENVGPAIASAIRQYILTKRRGRPDVPRTIYDIANEAKPVK